MSPPAKRGGKSVQKVSQPAQGSDETLYSKGTYVAYIDASDSLEKFKIGYVSSPSLLIFASLLIPVSLSWPISFSAQIINDCPNKKAHY